MRKKIAILLLGLLLASTMLGQPLPVADGITFTVDATLPEPERHDFFGLDAESVYERFMQERPTEGCKLVTASFANQRMGFLGRDNLYRMLVKAYADHRPVVLTPDAVWLVIGQGFARYVNAHPEAMRNRLVRHGGQLDLVVCSPHDLFSDDVEWAALLANFAAQIDKHTKGDIAQTITADFSTTGETERIASQITLMETLKSYFRYTVFYLACGIPSVTLEGTSDDWQRLQAKARRLAALFEADTSPGGRNMAAWFSRLDSILGEFAETARGRIDVEFWKSMVRRQRVDDLLGGGCDPDAPTLLDGWMLRLFPNEQGLTPDSVAWLAEMPSEIVETAFRYVVVDPASGGTISEHPMTLCAGIVGISEDEQSCALRPEVGWLVMTAPSDTLLAEELRRKDVVDEWGFGGIVITVDEVPEALALLRHINSLHLIFTDRIVLPKWMDQLVIDRLTVEGRIDQREAKRLRHRFPQIVIEERE